MRLVDIDNPELSRLLNRRIEGGEGLTVKEVLEMLATVQTSDDENGCCPVCGRPIVKE